MYENHLSRRGFGASTLQKGSVAIVIDAVALIVNIPLNCRYSLIGIMKVVGYKPKLVRLAAQINKRSLQLTATELLGLHSPPRTRRGVFCLT